MRIRFQLKSPVRHRSRLVAGLMLCLVAHGLLVDLTHHHSLKLGRDSAAGSVAEIQRSPDAPGESGSSRESACPSCRLHNTFSSQGRSSSVTIEFAARAVDYVALTLEPHTEGVPLLLASRAPPLV